MEIITIIQSIVIPIIIGVLTGGLGVVIYNGYQDKKKQIAAAPVEAKKVELEATDRAIANILKVQESIVVENIRLNGRVTEMVEQVRKSHDESEERFNEIQALLDDALKKLQAYRRYIQRVRRELAKQDITMPDPDPADAKLLDE